MALSFPTPGRDEESFSDNAPGSEPSHPFPPAKDEVWEPVQAPRPETTFSSSPPNPGYIPPASGSTTVPPVYSAPPLSEADERTWSMIAHLSILVNLFTGFIGPAIPLIIYLVFRDRSRYVAYQSMQSFIFQLIAWVGAGLIAALAWTISGILTLIVIGCFLMPIALVISLIPVAALIYGIIGAVETSQGRDFKYWLIGDWTHSLLKS